jgi:hypothetical protein
VVEALNSAANGFSIQITAANFPRCTRSYLFALNRPASCRAQKRDPAGLALRSLRGGDTCWDQGGQGAQMFRFLVLASAVISGPERYGRFGGRSSVASANDGHNHSLHHY